MCDLNNNSKCEKMERFSLLQSSELPDFGNAVFSKLTSILRILHCSSLLLLISLSIIKNRTILILDATGQAFSSKFSDLYVRQIFLVTPTHKHTQSGKHNYFINIAYNIKLYLSILSFFFQIHINVSNFCANSTYISMFKLKYYIRYKFLKNKKLHKKI